MQTYHQSYYERNKEYLRSYQRAYYYRKKNNIKYLLIKPKPREKPNNHMKKTYGTFIIEWE